MATERSKKTRALQKKAEKHVMLAHKYVEGKHTRDAKPKHNINNWLIFEKIDGVRAVFENNTLTSRAGNKFYAPLEFIQDIKKTFGSMRLDGELIHPDGFQTTVSIVKDQSDKAIMEFWKKITYVIFDHQGPKNFNYRLTQLLDKATINKSKYCKVLEPLGKVITDSSIEHYLHVVEGAGGEGLILRNPDSNYEYGRSHNLLKVKSFTDIDVIVKEIIKGEGKHSERMGKLVCKLPKSDKTFEVGTGFSDEQRENPPKVGSKIIVKFFEYTDGGLPRFPIFVGERAEQ